MENTLLECEDILRRTWQQTRWQTTTTMVICLQEITLLTRGRSGSSSRFSLDNVCVRGGLSRRQRQSLMQLFRRIRCQRW